MQRAYIEDSSDIVQLADEAIEDTGEVLEIETVEEIKEVTET